ncbi:MAG: 50S ribosomal protein L13 [Chloroflexi bacterium]|nr:50S ribosomal protein L13 [Chloroflexota bacterium]
MKTYSTKASDIKREWHLIDAQDKVLGKVATQAANLLMGKHKPIFVRNMDVGDYVVVINAEKVRVTGEKLKDKSYYRHSGYPGGFKSTSLEQMLATHPTRIIEHAVQGMLPHNRLEARMMTRLRIFTGEAHPYVGQVKAVEATAAAGEKGE